MSISTYNYIAFISYKREDEKWAKWLQQKIEYYKLPSFIRKRKTELEFAAHPRRVFRDKTEMSSGVLSKAIEEGLTSSKFLIVICSPRAVQSEWVNKEIQTYVDAGRTEYIIPFIVDGEPHAKEPVNECYPKTIQTLTKEKELLGVNINDDGRDAAAVKVVAYMLGLRFDELWQRFKRNKRIRNALLTSAIVSIAILSLFFSMTIWNKNRLIESQNEQLTHLVTNLQEENKTYSFMQGDAKPYTYLGQLRGNQSNLDRMNITFHPRKPLLAFSDDWGFWLHNLNTNVEESLPINKDALVGVDVIELYFSPDGKELVAKTGTTGVYIWDVESRMLIKHSMEEYTEEDYQPTVDKGEERMSAKVDDKYRDGRLHVIDKANGQVICSTDFPLENDIYYKVYNPMFDEILYTSDTRAALYDDTKREFVLFFKGDMSEFSYLDGFTFSEEGDYLRIGKNIYAKTMPIDTIRNLDYQKFPIENFPDLPKEKDYRYDAVNKATLSTDFDNMVIYRRGNSVKKIEAIKTYSSGNMQGYVSDALFAGTDKVVVIIGQDKHRVYSTRTWNLMGTLNNYVWDGSEAAMGIEMELGHAHSYIALAKYIHNKLYLLSSGGIIRIYNVDKLRLEAVVQLPIDTEDMERYNPLEKIYLKDDGACIYYSFAESPFYYRCELPQIQ